MSFPRYPRYRSSGLEWLGEVPEHWHVAPLKRVATIRYGIGEPPRYHEGGTPLIRATNVHAGRLLADGMVFVDPKDIPAPRIVWLVAGDIVVVRSGAYTGDSAIIPDWFGPSIAGFDMVLRCHSAQPRFVQFALLSSYLKEGQIELERMRAAQPHLNAEELGSCQLVLPGSDEQTLIASFLDRETAKIDGLVAEQRRLIDLLKEKRQAVISHAVTKGLNRRAPMKPSGVEWLGDVPAHWRVGKCGFYLSILSGFAFPSTGFSEDETNPRLLRGINVGVSRLKWDETVYWQRLPDDGLDLYEMRVGDLVIGMDRPLISEGIRVAKVREDDLPCLLLQRVASLKTGTQLNADYLLGLLSSEMFVAHFAPETTGVSVPHISPEQLYNFVIPVPPLAEQDGIVAFLAANTAKCDTLTAEAQRAIDLLQERRTALISAAVTGKIDVRGLAETEAA